MTKKLTFLLLGFILSLITAQAQTAFIEIDGSAGSNLGRSVSNAGDVNGDGNDDIIVGAYKHYYHNTNAGKVAIYYGGPSMDNIADVIMYGANEGDMLGYSVSKAGDVNGDGFDDVIVGAVGYNSFAGRAFIYFGGENMNNTADVIITGASASKLGSTVAYAGDMNGDGFDDVAISLEGYLSNRGRVNVYYGGTTMNNTSDLNANGEYTGDRFGYSVSYAGDVNEDGFDDIIIGAPYTGEAYPYSNNGTVYYLFGSATSNGELEAQFEGQSDNANLGCSVSNVGNSNICRNYEHTATGSKGENRIYFNDNRYLQSSTFGTCVSYGDFNNDGVDDIITSKDIYNSNRGAVSVIFGTNYELDNYWEVTSYYLRSISGVNENDYFGSSVSSAGDVNGDGIDDILIGAYGVNANSGKAYVYLGVQSPIIISQPNNVVTCPTSNSSVFVVKVENPDRISSFQWQYSDDGGEIFHDIGAPTVHHNIDTDTLKVNSSLYYNGNLYRCLIAGYNSGQVATDAVLLTVEDNTPPVLELQTIEVELDENGQATITSEQLISNLTDNCNIIDTTITQSNFSCANIGIANVGVSVEDGGWNVTTENVDITILDNISPSFTAQNITVELNENGEVNITPAQIILTANDNCTLSDTTLSQTFFNCNDIGDVEIQVSVKDNSSNITTQTVIVTVQDNTQPILAVDDIQIELDENGVAVIEALQVVLSASDNCSIRDTTLSLSNFNCTNLGVTPINVTINDQNGNSTILSSNITANDNITPTIQCVSNQIVNADDATNTYTVKNTEFAPASTWDNCDFTISNNINSLQTLQGEIFEFGNTNVTWTITDASGNTTYCNFVVKVNDYTTVIETLIKSGISIYPNPTNGIINFEFAENNIQKITISDITGKQIIEKTVTIQNEQIDLASFESGIYIISIQTDKEIFTTKIVKE